MFSNRTEPGVFGPRGPGASELGANGLSMPNDLIGESKPSVMASLAVAVSEKAPAPKPGLCSGDVGEAATGGSMGSPAPG